MIRWVDTYVLALIVPTSKFQAAVYGMVGIWFSIPIKWLDPRKGLPFKFHTNLPTRLLNFLELKAANGDCWASLYEKDYSTGPGEVNLSQTQGGGHLQKSDNPDTIP